MLAEVFLEFSSKSVEDSFIRFELKSSEMTKLYFECCERFWQEEGIDSYLKKGHEGIFVVECNDIDSCYGELLSILENLIYMFQIEPQSEREILLTIKKTDYSTKFLSTSFWLIENLEDEEIPINLLESEENFYLSGFKEKKSYLMIFSLLEIYIQDYLQYIYQSLNFA